MVDASDITDMLNVIGHIIDRGANRAVLGIVGQPFLTVLSDCFDGGICCPESLLHFPDIVRQE